MVVAFNLTGLPIPAESPTVILLPQQELTALVYGEPGHDEERFPVIRGAHVCMTQTIYLRDTFTQKKDADLSTLLHEVVHYLQCRDPRWSRATTCRKERQAYETERRFLTRRGVDFYATFGHTRASFAAFMATKCPHDPRFPRDWMVNEN